jgi:hypothetical protein
VHLHAAGPREADDPQVLRPCAEQVADLLLEVVFVLADVGVLDGQLGHAVHPAGRVGHVAHGDVGGTQHPLPGRVAGVDACLRHRRVRGDDRRAELVRSRAATARGYAQDAVAVRQLVRVAGADVLGAVGAEVVRMRLPVHVPRVACAAVVAVFARSTPRKLRATC